MFYRSMPSLDHQQRIDALRTLALKTDDEVLARRFRRLADGLEERARVPSMRLMHGDEHARWERMLPP